MWLQAPVEEDDGGGGKKRTTTAKDTGRGVPQGAPISALLANLYMRRFVLGWKKRGLERRFGAKIVSYADDFVICCKHSAEQAMGEMRQLMEQPKLTVNETKTHIRELPQERFDFLGYSFGRYYAPRTGRAYLCPQPSKKSVQRMIGEIREATDRKTTWQGAEGVVKQLNRKLTGWANYFSLGPVHKAYRAIDGYTAPRLRRWLCKKHKVNGAGTTRFPYEYLYDTLGLVKLQRKLIASRERRLEVLSESRMGAPMSGSMSGERKRSAAAWPKQPRLSPTLPIRSRDPACGSMTATARRAGGPYDAIAKPSPA
jgi:RNA-directed DNA polymerase